MAIISTYPISGQVNLTDILIGSDEQDANKTKNYTVDSILALLAQSTVTLPIHATNAAAKSAGLATGRMYRNAGDGTSSSVVCVVY
jgi:hypothetical protein